MCDMNIIGSLLLAWFLTWFSFEDVITEAMDELFNKQISVSSYYFMFFAVGALADIVGLFSD